MNKPNKKPSIDFDRREKQLINLAVECAEKQLREGTASSAVITHYLKLGSSKEKLEIDKLKKENELLKAKTEAITSTKNMEMQYEEAIKAFRSYKGE